MDDPTNGGAAYIGSAACGACHSNVGAAHGLHGHSQVLKATLGAPPVYPAGPGVPQPPPGVDWEDVNYVIGGYIKAADFVDREGMVLTDGSSPQLLYHLPFTPTLTAGGFSASADQVARTPYTFDCFRCHTTAPQSVADNGGRRQGNLPGIGGTWFQDGVQCEACHGPGGSHVPNPRAGNIYIDPTSASCERCHSGFDSSDTLTARDGYIVGNEQADEVEASPHRGFGCGVCHDPHSSVFYDASEGIRNDCRGCHATMDLALHEGKTYTRDGYVEPLTCTSCHMPFASKYATSAPPESFGETPGRMGDTRTHVMNIDTRLVDFTSMFTVGGGAVATDQNGEAAVTLDFVCLRCHTGLGNAFELTLPAVSGVAGQMHQLR